MVEIVDNFLSEKEFTNIQEVMLGSYFPWYYNSSTSYLGGESHDWIEPQQEFDLYDFQFIHNFYLLNNLYGYQDICSPYTELIHPILKKLN